MLKLLGACLVLLGSSGLGWYAAGRYAARIHILEELEQALQFLYGEIEYAGCDMAELLGQLALRGQLFSAFFAQMQSKILLYDGNPFSYHWRQNLTAVTGYETLQREDLELLCAIGDNLGNMDRQTQLHTIQIFRKRLGEIVVQARREYRAKAKVSGVIGVTAGLFLAIILI
ncbi:MAG: stage III sporulation protein AB [Clostridiaceae bacterium]|nr:stage III sporulation protein AB [Clostridiaceae bacterium]